MSRWLCTLCLALLCAAPARAGDVERIGLVRTVEGEASILRSGASLPATVGRIVHRGDVVRTGTAGSVGLLLDDETSVSLGPDGELSLRVFSYAPREDRFAFVARMAKGTFSYLAGLIAKLAPGTVQLQLPEATIAVRGTKLLVEIAGPPGAVEQAVVLLPDPDGRVGAVEVATAGGARRLSKAGEMTRVTGAAAPAEVTLADPAWIAATFREALAAEAAPPERTLLYFESGTTELTAESQGALPAVAASVRLRGASSVSIVGHADATGPEALNEELSLARAERVRALLLELGVDPALMQVSSRGKESPLVPTADGVPEPRNRRVELLVR